MQVNVGQKWKLCGCHRREAKTTRQILPSHKYLIAFRQSICSLSSSSPSETHRETQRDTEYNSGTFKPSRITSLICGFHIFNRWFIEEEGWCELIICFFSLPLSFSRTAPPRCYIWIMMASCRVIYLLGVFRFIAGENKYIYIYSNFGNIWDKMHHY